MNDLYRAPMLLTRTDAEWEDAVQAWWETLTRTADWYWENGWSRNDWLRLATEAWGDDAE